MTMKLRYIERGNVQNNKKVCQLIYIMVGIPTHLQIGEKMKKITKEEILKLILEMFEQCEEATTQAIWLHSKNQTKENISRYKIEKILKENKDIFEYRVGNRHKVHIWYLKQ